MTRNSVFIASIRPNRTLNSRLPTSRRPYRTRRPRKASPTPRRSKSSAHPAAQQRGEHIEYRLEPHGGQLSLVGHVRTSGVTEAARTLSRSARGVRRDVVDNVIGTRGVAR